MITNDNGLQSIDNSLQSNDNCLQSNDNGLQSNVENLAHLAYFSYLTHFAYLTQLKAYPLFSPSLSYNPILQSHSTPQATPILQSSCHIVSPFNIWVFSCQRKWPKIIGIILYCFISV